MRTVVEGREVGGIGCRGWITILEEKYEVEEIGRAHV